LGLATERYKYIIEYSDVTADIQASLLGLFGISRLSESQIHRTYLESVAKQSEDQRNAALIVLVQAYHYWDNDGLARAAAQSMIDESPGTWYELSARLSLFWLDFWAEDYITAEGHLASAAPRSADDVSIYQEASNLLSKASGRPAVAIVRDTSGPDTRVSGFSEVEPAVVDAYPNPFNPSTTLRIRLSEPAWTEIEVYDTVGRRIAVLLSRQLNVGDHAVSWDASDHPSGTYFVVVRTGGVANSIPIVLQK
jgi:hypothetical protein